MNTDPTRVEGPSLVDGLQRVSYFRDRYTKERGGDFSNSTTINKLSRVAFDTLTLYEPAISRIDIANHANALFDITVSEIPELRKGKENSKAEVKFGQLHIAQPSQPPVAELVAVKRMSAKGATREFHAGQAVDTRMGEALTFRGVGIAVESGSRVKYLTQYEHAVISLDNVLWNESSSPEQRQQALSFAGAWLANLHNHDIQHGDAQAKNIAYDAAHRFRYIDLEGAEDMTAKHVVEQKMMRILDVKDLFNPVFMPPTTNEEEVTFIDAYLGKQDERKFITGKDISLAIDEARELAS